MFFWYLVKMVIGIYFVQIMFIQTQQTTSDYTGSCNDSYGQNVLFVWSCRITLTTCVSWTSHFLQGTKKHTAMINYSPCTLLGISCRKVNINWDVSFPRAGRNKYISHDRSRRVSGWKSSTKDPLTWSVMAVFEVQPLPDVSQYLE